MRLKKKKDPVINNMGHLAGVLYTTKKVPASAKELDFKKNTPNKFKSFFESVARSLKQQVSPKSPKRIATLNPKKVQTILGTSDAKAVKAGSFKKDRRLLAVVACACSAVLVATMLFTAGFFAPKRFNVVLNDAGRTVSAVTTERTVGAFFDKNGVQVDKEDVLEVSLDAQIHDGMEIVIRRAMPITIFSGDKQVEIKMLAGTVKEALTRADIEVAEDDEVYPSMDTYVKSGMSINHIEVDVQYLVEKEDLEYKEITKSDNSIAKGKEVLAQKGRKGTQHNEVKVVYKNGEEISREVVKTEVVKKPVDEIILIGSYVEKKQTPSTSSDEDSSKKTSSKSKSSSNDSKKSSSSSGSASKTPSTSQIHSSTLYEHRKKPAPDESIIAKTVVINHITAYTHTGNRTATGTWPKIGTIAADPKRFPYGTKVYVPGYGYGRIEDTGGFRDEARTVFDLFMDTKSDCIRWGRHRNVKVYILK